MHAIHQRRETASQRAPGRLHTEASPTSWQWPLPRFRWVFRPDNGRRHHGGLSRRLELVRHTAAQLARPSIFWYDSRMSQPLTADDLLPLIVKLSSAERRKLFLLIQKVGSDVEAYRAAPPAQGEFSSDEDMLAWDADGWEDVK